MSEVPSPGLLVMVTGPSGVGKDSILGALRVRLSGGDRVVHFPQRVITRPAGIGGEDNIAVTDPQFQDMLRRDAFALHWQAHGYHYGISRSALAPLRQGQAVVFNGSRTMVDVVRRQFPNRLLVAITADPEICADRLSGRGRESEVEISQRLARQVTTVHHPDDSVTIDNSGALDNAVDQFVAEIHSRLSRG